MPPLLDLVDVRARLERDRPWAAFSLADLDPPLAPHAAWFGAEQGSGVVLVYGAYAPPITICHGDIAECDALLDEPAVVARTARTHLNVTPDQLLVLGRHFRAFEERRMRRMLLPGDAALPALRHTVVRLGSPDLVALQALYGDEPPAFFLPAQLRDGVYYAVREGSSLIAVAGTHVVSTAGRVGAIGNVYTRRDRRGRGLAASVTAAVARELRRLGIATIVLNVVASNAVARRVYERLGFRDNRIYFEGLAER
ncbi:MAG TPA: GNAT family N-acetyltransferase [Vicinamibacterales bacterium]|nr:GNAT family N-acetyltransferase [Vicinamibacterales bacterium]